MTDRPALVLASGSPRRRDLLTSVDLAFTVEPPDVDETPLPDEDPVMFAERIARAKASAVDQDGRVVLAADTIVVVDGAILGKPGDEAEARRMLGTIAGRNHTVITAVALAVDGAVHSTVDRSEVSIAPLDEDEITRYVATGEPMDKAGAYAIQGIGGVYVEAVRGSSSNVVGLPLAATRRLFAAAGLDLLSFRREPVSAP